MGDITYLLNRSILKLEGQDAASLLQGLVTQDITLLEDQPSIYTGLLSPQGKILHDFFVFRMKDFYLIDCHTDQKEDLHKRLTMYILRADVSISDVTKFYRVIVSLAHNTDLPNDPRTKHLGGRLIIEQDDVHTGNDTEYHINRIKNGIADSSEIGSGQFFPHECNFDQLSGVSFTKGCFVGQEVVSRMEHRATARNRILPFRTTIKNLEINEVVTCDERTIGTVIGSAGEYGLAILRLDRLGKCGHDHPVLAGTEKINVYKPDWATFDTENIEGVSE